MVRYQAPKIERPPVPAGQWISVDPGDVHVGVCFWIGREPQWAKEFDQETFVDWLVPRLVKGELELVVHEIFMLYQSKAVQQTGSKFLTSELIGVMRHLCRRAKVPFHGYQASTHKMLYKNPDYRPPKMKLQDWVSYGNGSHCKDAECVGRWHIRANDLKDYGF